jgi:sarcosine oxidase subunit alpha
MKKTDILIVGGGPAGLCAAKAASSLGASVLICERDEVPGGQIVKQTHKFFGSKKQYAGDRGIAIGDFLREELAADPKAEVMPKATVIGIYRDGVVLAEAKNEKIIKIAPQKIVIATGAAEKFLLFPGNDLPGIYGAGAVQTLMHVEGVVPGERVLMVGAGNIGLIVSYQLTQAGVEVSTVVEGAPSIGGYLVHASKIRRSGIPIRTRHTIKEAYGNGKVEGAVICRLDEKWQTVPGTEEDVKCDTICLAVGLTPLVELCWQAGCRMAFIRELSGHVPVVDRYLATTNPRVYAAGDVSGVEEASSAMVAGRLAGYSAALSLGYGGEEAHKLREGALAELNELRAGPVAKNIREGLLKMEKLGGKP